MSRVQNDPEALKKFAFKLKRHAEEIQKEMQASRRDLTELNSEWKDQEFHRFNERFKESENIIKSLMKSMEDYHHYLLAKARKLDDYLNTRM